MFRMTNTFNVLSTLLLYAALLIALMLWSPWGEDFENVRQYHFYYLLAAAVIWLLGFKLFGGRFIRPKWKIPGKLIGYMMLSFIALILFGHYALIFIIGHQAIGGVGHYLICKNNNIDFWTCEPESKYLAVTEKWAKGSFDKENQKKEL